ncbi:MAG: DUF3467 domain-containing protein [Bacteroidia bacterium]|nr:DUF3467 domain-containing protein [Bacteroidia bacterium]
MDDQQKKKTANQINIELSAETARGVYSNLAVISHSHSEFILDFIQILSGTPKAEVRSRVIMTPQNAKRLLLALRENIEKFEQTNGEVIIPDKDLHLPPNFGGPAGYA